MNHPHRNRHTNPIVLCFFAGILATMPSFAGSTDVQGAIDVPVTIDVSVDEGTLALHGATEVRISIRASAALTGLRVRTAARGNLEILENRISPDVPGRDQQDNRGPRTDPARLDQAPLGANFDRAALGAGEEISFTLPVRLQAYGESGLSVDVFAALDSGLQFSKERELNIYLRTDRAFASNEDMVNLRREAVRYDQQIARIDPRKTAEALAELDKVDIASSDEIVDVASPNANRQLLRVDPAPPDEIESSTEDHGTPGSGGSGAASNINVYGTVQYLDENGVAHPVFGYGVQVRDDDLIGSDLLANVATDTNGNYNVIVSSDDPNGPDIFVRFKPVNTLIEVRPKGGGSYENNTGITDNVGSNASLERNITFAATGDGPVGSVLSGMTYIAVFNRDSLNGGAALAQIPVEFPGATNAAFYNGSLINMRPNDRFDWDVMHHEYGHYIMDSFNFENNPGGPHNIGDCVSVVQGSKSKGVRLAWGEAWPTYNGTSAQMLMGLGFTEAPRVGDAVYTDTVDGFGGFSYGLDTNSNNLGGGGDTAGLGEDNEVAVQRLLYDLWDTNGDSRDTVVRNHVDLFNVVKNSGVTTLSGAWALLRASGLVADNEDDLDFGAITTDHAVGPQPLAPSAGTIVTTANANFSWNALVGCSGSFAGDDFDLVFYDADTFAEILSIPSGTNSASLSPAQLGTLIAANHDVLWAVEGSNTSGPATGPYLGDNAAIVVNTPPEANAGPDQPSVECSSHTTTPVALNGTGSSDADGDALTYSWSAAGVVFDDSTSATPTGQFHKGSTVVTLTVSDGIEEDSDTMTVTVVDTTPPVIACPADITAECTGNHAVQVNDPQLAPFFAGVSAVDTCDASPGISNDAPGSFPLGDTTVTFTAIDADGNTSSCEATVTVVDTTPPEISVSLDQTVLWPANHKMVEINATVEVTDICDTNPTFVLTSITSSEPDDANGNGDGNTIDDIQGADFGTADTSFMLRAERAGGGEGRVYTITYTGIDSSNNMTDAVVEVFVPHKKP